MVLHVHSDHNPFLQILDHLLQVLHCVQLHLLHLKSLDLAEVSVQKSPAGAAVLMVGW